jgi:thiol:disulfide interchange protein DsbA
MNIEGLKGKYSSIPKRYGCILLAIILSLPLWRGMALALGEENLFPSFGSGPIQVRLYTDYFCPPCRDMEPSIEPILLALVKDGTIHLTFVDVPTSQHTVLYANYFLYALAEKRDLDSAILARRTLFEAAEKKVLEKDQLVNLLTQKGIGLKPLDVKPVYNLWNRHLQEDKIRSTPSCVIAHGDLKETHVGGLKVIKALETLKETLGEKPASFPKDGKSENTKMGEPSSLR